MTRKWKTFNLIPHQVNKQRSTMSQQSDKLHSTVGVFPIRAHYSSLLLLLTLTLKMQQDSAERGWKEEVHFSFSYLIQVFRINKRVKVILMLQCFKAALYQDTRRGGLTSLTQVFGSLLQNYPSSQLLIKHVIINTS